MSIFLYNDNSISKISLIHEFKYLFEDYIEIGKYKSALLLSRDNKMIGPKIHKIYGDYLFENKQFMKAEEEYAYSDEIFEHVCLKFLNANNNLGLLKYLLLVYNLRMKRHEEYNDNRYFIEKYLVNTFLFEILIEIYENKKSIDFISIFEDKRINKNDFDTILLYYILNIYGKYKELFELATIKADYDTINLRIINQKRINESLGYLNLYLIKDSKIFYFVYNIKYRRCFEELFDWIKIAKESLGAGIIYCIIGENDDLIIDKKITEEEPEIIIKSIGMNLRFLFAKKDEIYSKKVMEKLFDDYLSDIGKNLTKNKEIGTEMDNKEKEEEKKNIKII